MQVDSGLSIDTFAQRIGEKPQRVKDALRGKQRPPWEMLAMMVSELGVDAAWLLTGKSQAVGLSQDEALLLARYRAASTNDKAAILAAAMGIQQARTVINAQGDIGQTYQVSGDVNQRGMTINMGGKKKG